jgi:hypothetical protein
MTVSGLPALIIQVGFIVVFSAPVWAAARIVRARHPTLIRAILSLLVGAVGSGLSVAFGGALALVLAPLAFLLAFKFVLGTSYLGSIGLALVALLGYWLMVHFIGANFEVPETQKATVVQLRQAARSGPGVAEITLIVSRDMRSSISAACSKCTG